MMVAVCYSFSCIHAGAGAWSCSISCIASKQLAICCLMVACCTNSESPVHLALTKPWVW